MGETIGGYTLLKPLQNKNAGFSRWTFAEKDGKEFFIKELLDPLYPVDEELSEKIKSDMLNICNEYECEKVKIFSAINKSSDGNLVRIRDFFRYDAHYYIVTEKIEESAIKLADVQKLPYESKLFLCLSLAHSLCALAEAGIVHGDIKDTNVILKRTEKGKIIGKVIDFDGAFFEDAPPEDEGIVGDQVYISPEVLKYLFDGEDSLSCKMDVFALGILFHQYFTGSVPDYNREEYDCLAEALLEGDETTRLSGELNPDVGYLIRDMLMKDPGSRIDIKEVFERLSKLVVIKNEKEPRGFFYNPGNIKS